MTRTKDLNGIGTLTIQCADLTCFWDIFIAVEDAFYVTCDPGQKYSGTIEGRDRWLRPWFILMNGPYPMFHLQHLLQRRQLRCQSSKYEPS
mmetsp:Transcript_12619/g.27061  ORF Transcript_12619/g.27061 Transcript_12619/m.27061 type:complete len:91 (-) Transcript_12619:83-355(-)